MSSPNIKVEKSENDHPKSTAQYERDRRMSMPNTNAEIEAAKEIMKQNKLCSKEMRMF